MVGNDHDGNSGPWRGNVGDFMGGFKWNGIHTSEAGIIVDTENLPLTPAPKIFTEELPARDGFFDLSKFNNAGRVHYSPRQWSFRCYLKETTKAEFNRRINKLAEMFVLHDGYLEVDSMPGVKWKAIITNHFDFVRRALKLHQFNVFFQSQAFAEGLNKISLPPVAVESGDTITVENPGTWFVRPDVFLTGEADNAKIGGMPVPEQNTLENVLAWAPELAPGENKITVEGFTGDIVFEFTPLYIWGAV